MSQFRFGSRDTPVQSGFSGFPIPVTKLSGSAAHLFPVPLGLAGKWWWRVRQWILTSSVVYSPVTPGVPDLSFDGGILTNDPILTDEMDLIVPANVPSFSCGATSGGVPANMWGGSFNFNPFLGGIIGDWGDPKNPKFYLNLNSALGNLSVSSFGVFQEGVTFLSDPTSPGRTGNIAIVIDGVHLDASYQLGGGTFGGTFSLAPHSYWSYDGIYNTTTGAVNDGRSIFELPKDA